VGGWEEKKILKTDPGKVELKGAEGLNGESKAETHLNADSFFQSPWNSGLTWITWTDILQIPGLGSTTN
jgi:hypothetical protein